MEPVFASLGARGASLAAVPLVRKILVAHGPGAGLTPRGTPLARTVAWGGKQPKITEKDVRKLVGNLVETTLDSDPELQRLSEDPEPLVEAICRTVLALGDLQMSDIQAVHLRHEGLARRLKQEKPEAQRELSPDFAHLYDTILNIICLHVLEFFSSRPEFVTRTLVEQTEMLHQQDRKLLSLLERLPDPKSSDRKFEERYSESVIRRYDELTIFGLDLKNSEASWPLDTAYLSLEAIQGGRYSSARMPDPFSTSHAPAPASDMPERVERALAGRPRVLMRGLAGSGKTTLIQWLAVTAARQEFRDDLADLNLLIPFVLPLRTLARDSKVDLPTPDQFLHRVNNMQAGAQPAGWAQRIMDQGRALLLIDGIDEVSEAFRVKTRIWLRTILKEFPQTHCVVTARPSAIPEGWLEKDEFHEIALSPMRPHDVQVFVHRWHNAAISQTHDASMRAELEGFVGQLLETIDSKSDIARIATNPLMCALICALHRDKRGRLPRGRKALYDAALRMLLTERDDQRDIESPEGVILDEDDQLLLLQKIAYWLIRNGLAEVEIDTTLKLVEKTLPYMPSVGKFAEGQEAPRRVFNHLLSRSGLLREPSTETIEFIHRTFQDYLGARAAVESEDIPYLIQQAHKDQWEDVIRMAIAHCRPKERARLLKGIIDRGDQEPTHRHRLHLLSLVCLEHSPELDPELQNVVRQRAGMLLPPDSMDEAEVLAQVGPVLLELLPGPSGLTPRQARAAIRAASLVGGTAALRTIAKYASDPRPPVIREVVSAWDRFEADTFARIVLAHCSFPLRVASEGQATACNNLPNVRDVTCVGPGSVERLMPRLPTNLTSIGIHDDEELQDFSALSRFPDLRNLRLSECRNLWNLSTIVDCSKLEFLDLERLELRSYRELTLFPRLRGLSISDSVYPVPLNEFPVLPDMTTLLLRGNFDVGEIRTTFPGLTSLSLQQDTPIGTLEWLGPWSSLQSLQVTAADQAGGVTLGLSGASNLRRLSLNGVLPAYFGKREFDEILKPLPHLQELELSWEIGQLAIVDVTYLSGIRPDLAVRLLGADEVRGREGFDERHLKVE